MLTVPLPFLVGLAVVLTLHRSLRGVEAPGSRAYFIAFLVLYAFQGIIVGLRFGYGVHILEPIQPLTASIMPPLAFLAFRALAEPAPKRPWLHLLGPAAMLLALRLNVDWVDPLLLALFSFYGIALFRLTLVPGDAMAVAPFQRAGPALRAARLIAGLLLFFAVTDASLAVYAAYFGTEKVPAAVGLMNLAVIVALLIYSIGGDMRPAPAPPSQTPVDAADEALLARIASALDEGGLFKDENLSLSKLARKAGLPARDVSSVVNRARGLNVSQFVNNRRIAEACRLLETTSENVTSIMLSSGFGTKSNFNREFRRVTGMSPGQWRATHGPDSQAPAVQHEEDPQARV
ncbi:helix-turn-helix domain-containing protein [Rhizobium sp. C4]|uniref:helix-turn-helix domain-containing protein n=1 Tax=Rhizobium sp. C4 TaxID=1349800 RepID=UPI001E5925DB|nr:AraC family transcriptional regulator [Rhizobium sp. C4]MCD2175374.1 AraC family transcriptional regulator [Rhizobium sp. C4]